MWLSINRFQDILINLFLITPNSVVLFGSRLKTPFSRSATQTDIMTDAHYYLIIIYRYKVVICVCHNNNHPVNNHL